MKIYLSLIAVLCLIFINQIPSLADCFTGFACSISDLEQENNLQNQAYQNTINNYFDKTISADLFFNQNKNNFQYNDLFIFNTIV